MEEDTPYIINIRKACARICFNYKKDTNRKNILVLLTVVPLRKNERNSPEREARKSSCTTHFFLFDFWIIPSFFDRGSSCPLDTFRQLPECL